MTLYGLIAHPAGHSRSPQMQNMMIAEYGIDAHYHAFNILPEKLEEAIVGLKALHVGGFNVSTPFKNEIIQYLDELSPISQRLHAVNTVKSVKGHLIGTNTDGDGFWQSINSRQPKEMVIVLGTGGAARSVIATAKLYGVRELIVFNRVHEDWHERKAEISYLSEGNGHLEDLADNQMLTKALKRADMLINATTVGMNDLRTLLTDLQIALLPQHALVVDMIYRNQQTTLLKSANQRGLATLNGLPMLVNQGALSFEYWFDRPADRNLMKKAIEE